MVIYLLWWSNTSRPVLGATEVWNVFPVYRSGEVGTICAACFECMFFHPSTGILFISYYSESESVIWYLYMCIYIWAFSWNWLVVNYAIPSSVRQTFDKDNIPPVLPAKFFADLWRNLVSFLIKCCFCFFWIIVYFQTHLSSSRGCFGSCAGARLPSKRLRNTLWKKTSSPTAQGALLVHVLWCAWTSGN